MPASRPLTALTLTLVLGVTLACGGLGGDPALEFKPLVTPNVAWLEAQGVTTIVSNTGKSDGMMLWMPGGHTTGEDGQAGRVHMLEYPAEKLSTPIGAMTHMCMIGGDLEKSVDKLIDAHDDVWARKDDDKPVQVQWTVYRTEPRAEIARITLLPTSGCSIETLFF